MLRLKLNYVGKRVSGGLSAATQQYPLLLTWFNINLSMDK